MKAGTTFLRADRDRHLWVVVSDPKKDSDRVLIVNLTTEEEDKDDSCVLSCGDHPWITHKTCVNYHDSVITTLALLNAARSGRAICLREEMKAEVLKLIREGAMNSRYLSDDRKNLLTNQGLMDL